MAIRCRRATVRRMFHFDTNEMIRILLPVPTGTSCGTQNVSACINLYYINCNYNNATMTCDAVQADFCQSLPLSEICAANVTCVWQNSSCADCAIQPCFSEGMICLVSYRSLLTWRCDQSTARPSTRRFRAMPLLANASG